MAQAASQTELMSALSNREPTIQITAGFTIASQINISYPVKLESTGDPSFPLLKDRTHAGYLFRIMDGGSLTLENVILDGNSAAHPADASENRSLILVTGGTLILLGNTVIRSNNSYLGGGGICLKSSPTSPNTLSIRGSARVTDCFSRTSGGGIMIASENNQDNYTITQNAVIDGNQAAEGGGCFLSCAGTPVSVYLEGASITDNTAGTGGGLYLLTDSGGSLTITRSTITGNRAEGEASGSGGGIFMQNTSAEAGLTVLLNGSSLEQNTAAAHAGGLALYGGGGSFSFRITESSIADNRAAKEGGGLLVSNSGTGLLSFIQASVINNTAGGSGGGINYANAGSRLLTTFILTGSDFSGNTAGGEGGGMRLTSGSGSLITSLTDCIVNANTAQGNSGGGIWNGGANNVLTIDGNTAVTQNITETGNGGGICFTCKNGTVYLSGSAQITYNLADFKASGPGGHGGGICLVPGVINIQDQAVIGFNRAGKYGGGISAAENSRIHVTGGILSGNRSEAFGGGLWIHGDSTAVITGGSFTGNAAPYGGDIYNDAYLYVSEDRTLSDGVCIAGRRSVIRLKNALTGSSLIRLERSAYITTNAEGIPVVAGEADREYPVLSQTDAAAFLKPEDGFEGWDIQLSDDRTHVLLAPVLYQIHYENLMGSDQQNPDIYTIESPDIRLLPPSPLPGYRFLGWFKTLSGGNEITVIPHGSNGDLTLYAVWEKITSEYTITFCGNACCPEACSIPGPVTVSAEESIFLPDLQPRRRGYAFCGWNTDSCGNGEYFRPGEMLSTLQENLELYAIWKRKRFFWF